MSPEEAKGVATFLIADFENEMKTTERVLGELGADPIVHRNDQISVQEIELK